MLKLSQIHLKMQRNDLKDVKKRVIKKEFKHHPGDCCKLPKKVIMG
jgi:hypothetical protein